MTIQSFPVVPHENRADAPLANSEIHSACGTWGEWDQHGLAAFAVHQQSSMAAFQPEEFDIGADCFRHA
jgi:hypothetical protein